MLQRQRQTVTGIIAGWGAIAFALGGVNPGQEKTLTFFGWSDQHVQTDGNGEHLIPAINAMNALPGRTWPEVIGGVVTEPAFVFGLSDITEWPTNAAKDTYEPLITQRLKSPSYDVAGNHDTGGNAAQPDRPGLARGAAKVVEQYSHAIFALTQLSEGLSIRPCGSSAQGPSRHRQRTCGA